ncbi:branched-chain amino acid ABC transporter permease [Mesorhizobium sp. Pch-S]|uniref:branched-chain amino acid ABC transporter permease n=1 Tax=Mesorhizobium sp. Pch-S TaxID=2082387 RepID=UPI0010108995|nr:branched-chain amino acid ABC transporter permease [Mesorhizobium sp. Pch-S]QAZ45162.1 branched-chain amino acid ABC transporter permease [Mesorhizobium sp. Pch-S]
MDPLIITQLLNIVFGVTTLAMIALGLAVTFGMLGVLNLAHGEFVMMGAFCALVVDRAGAPFLLAVPLALLVCGGVGLIVEVLLIRPLYRRPFDTLVATWGLSLLLRKLAEAGFGLGFNSVAVPLAGTMTLLGTDYPTYRLMLIVVCVTIIGALFAWYGTSRAGLRIRAMVGNPDLARALGMPVKRLATTTFVVGSCLAGLAGVMVAPLVPVHPYLGLDYVIKSFFVLVVGGLGSVLGVVAGTGVIGGLDSLMSAVFGSTQAYFTVLVVAILFLWLKPRGLFAHG